MSLQAGIYSAWSRCLPCFCAGIIAGLLVQNSLKYLLSFGQVTVWRRLKSC